MADRKVKGLSLSRDGNRYQAKWSVPSSTKKRIRGMTVERLLDRVGASDKWAAEYRGNSKTKASQAVSFSRGSYYPHTSTRLAGISARVRCWKKAGGKSLYGAASATYALSVPDAPGTMKASVNDDGDVLTVEFDVDEGAGHAERRDTVHRWYVMSGSGGQAGSWKAVGAAPAVGRLGQTGTSLTLSTKGIAEFAGVNALADDQWVVAKVEAWSRGLRGDGPKRSASHVFAQPAKPTLSSPRLTTNQVIVPLTTNSSTYHPVDAVQLYRYIGTSMASNMDDWTKVDGSADDGNCTGLHDAREDSTPTDTGQRVWYRVAATHDSYRVYSDPVECVGLHKAADTSEGSRSAVLSATNKGDGESVLLRVGWPGDDAARYDTSVVSWSTDPEAWISTEEPDSHELDDVTWRAGETTVGSETWSYADVKVKGLDDGSTYHFRVRRASSSNDQKGAWSAAVTCTVSSVPPQPVLSAPGTVERGAGFAVSWASGSGTQAAWRLVLLNPGLGDVAVLAEGTGSGTSALVPAGEARLSALASATLAVEVSTGGDFVRSDPVTVAFAERPVATVTCSRTIAGSGHPFSVRVEPSGSVVTCELVAEGATSPLPDGSDVQAAGDVVWSSGEAAVAADGTVALSVGAAARLVDGARYRLRVTPRNAGLAGNVAEPSFAADEDGGDGPAQVHDLEVAFAHQAHAPASCLVSVDPEEGSAAITPEAPEGAADGDTFAVYRLTPDGAACIGDGFAFGETCTDPVPPFRSSGECSYRVATFTTDGDCDWDDFPYGYAKRAVRIDWDGGSVELPYGVETSDSFEKSFGRRSFLDSSRPSGTWGPGVVRTVSVDADIEAADPETAGALRSLARHAGSCFARFPDGRAFECDAQVSSVDQSPGGSVSVSMDLTEVALSTYRAEGR